jgi:hypothetical protein
MGLVGIDQERVVVRVWSGPKRGRESLLAIG